jgi:hypothetical protein
MKIRNGFVSNSSSSSFILKLNKRVSSSDELKDVLFGDKEVLVSNSKGTPIEVDATHAASELYDILTPSVDTDELSSDIRDVCVSILEYKWDDHFMDLEYMKKRISEVTDEYVSESEPLYKASPYSLEHNIILDIPEVDKLIIGQEQY